MSTKENKSKTFWRDEKGNLRPFAECVGDCGIKRRSIEPIQPIEPESKPASETKANSTLEERKIAATVPTDGAPMYFDEAELYKGV